METSAVTDSTVSGNSASDIGGGIYNFYGGGHNLSGDLTVGDTIIAGNSSPTGPDVEGPVGSSGNNLVGATDGST